MPKLCILNSTKPTKLLDKREHKDAVEPYLQFESESPSDSDEGPELSNVVMRTNTIILIENYSLGLNNFLYLSTTFLFNVLRF